MRTVTERPKINPRKYGEVLSKALPRAIRNDKELEDMTAELLRLSDLEEDGKASTEERELAELLAILIEHYEDEHYPIEITGILRAVDLLVSALTARKKSRRKSEAKLK